MAIALRARLQRERETPEAQARARDDGWGREAWEDDEHLRVSLSAFLCRTLRHALGECVTVWTLHEWRAVHVLVLGEEEEEVEGGGEGEESRRRARGRWRDAGGKRAHATADRPTGSRWRPTGSRWRARPDAPVGARLPRRGDGEGGGRAGHAASAVDAVPHHAHLDVRPRGGERRVHVRAARHTASLEVGGHQPDDAGAAARECV